jgi:hypothetical protein
VLSVTLDREDVEAVALRVVELLEERRVSPAPGLVDAQMVADRLGVTRDYVYAHAAELGGRRIGSGSRPRWRFDLDAAAACFVGRSSSEPETPAVKPIRSRRPKRSAGTGVELLPIRGVSGA